MRTRCLAFTTLVILYLQGCAVSDRFGERVGPGSARYVYTHTMPDKSQCSVEILSARDVMNPKLTIDKDCSLTSGADQTTGVDKALGVLDNAIDFAKTAASKAP